MRQVRRLERAEARTRRLLEAGGCRETRPGSVDGSRDSRVSCLQFLPQASSLHQFAYVSESLKFSNLNSRALSLFRRASVDKCACAHILRAFYIEPYRRQCTPGHVQVPGSCVCEYSTDAVKYSYHRSAPFPFPSPTFFSYWHVLREKKNNLACIYFAFPTEFCFSYPFYCRLCGHSAFALFSNIVIIFSESSPGSAEVSTRNIDNCCTSCSVVAMQRK